MHCSIKSENSPRPEASNVLIETGGPILILSWSVWPADVDDSAARKDWHWEPDYDQTRAFEEYLIPAVKKYYQSEGVGFQQ